MWAAYIISASLYLALSLSKDPCSPMPSFCGGEVDISDCVLRNDSVQLSCSVNKKGASVRWFHANTSNWNGFSFTNQKNVLITSQGYWWCTVTDIPSCPSYIPAVHVYPCMCNSSQRLCPRKCERTSDNYCQNRPRRERLRLCLTTTEILLSLSKTVSATYETNNIPTSTKTWKIPYQTSFEHTIDTTTQMWPQSSLLPSIPPAADEVDRKLANSSVVPYILGGVAVVAVLTIIVLSLGIGCHKRKYLLYRLGSRTQSNSSCNNEVEHIYDTVNVFDKSATRLSTLRYTTQGNASEYEIPVITSGVRKSNVPHQNCTNPTYMEVYGTQKQHVDCSNKLN